jgi:uncharacterized protein (DUF2267 family)
MNKHEFLQNVMNKTGMVNESDAEYIVAAILRVLNSQLSGRERKDLDDVLPNDIDSMFEGSLFDRFIARIQSLHTMVRDDFIEQVREAADLRTTFETEKFIMAVFSTLKATIPQTEVKHLHNELTDGVTDMWDAA